MLKESVNYVVSIARQLDQNSHTRFGQQSIRKCDLSVGSTNRLLNPIVTAMLYVQSYLATWQSSGDIQTVLVVNYSVTVR